MKRLTDKLHGKTQYRGNPRETRTLKVEIKMLKSTANSRMGSESILVPKHSNQKHQKRVHQLQLIRMAKNTTGAPRTRLGLSTRKNIIDSNLMPVKPQTSTRTLKISIVTTARIINQETKQAPPISDKHNVITNPNLLLTLTTKKLTKVQNRYFTFHL